MVESVQYSWALITKLENSIKSAFNQRLVKLNGKPDQPGTRFDVSLRIGRPFTVDRSEFLVLPILTSEEHSTSFWFGFVADFEIADIRRYKLTHASLMVLHDIGFALEPIFRAEWDHMDAMNTISKHAQPHWHFVQSPERIEMLVRTLLTPEGETVTEFAPERKSEMFFGLADYGKFHFAMTSLWEKSETPPYRKRVFDSNNFPRWFDNLTSYIAGQIAYLLSHTRAAATSEEKAFEG